MSFGNVFILDLPWGLPLGFPSMPAFGAFPPFGLPTPNFGSLNSFASSSPTTPTTTTSGNTGAFPPPTHPLLPSDPTNSTDLWSNGLAAAAAAAAASATNSTLDYNEYAKQLGFLMNAFTEQQKVQETEKPKSSPAVKSSKHSSDVSNGKSSKSHDDHRRSSSTSRSKPSSNSSPSVSAAPTPTPDPSMLDPLAFAAAAAAAAASSGGLGFPYFLPSALNNTGATPNPFAGLANPTAGLYPFLSPDWFSSTSTLPNMSPGSFFFNRILH